MQCNRLLFAAFNFRYTSRCVYGSKIINICRVSLNGLFSSWILFYFFLANKTRKEWMNVNNRWWNFIDWYFASGHLIILIIDINWIFFLIGEFLFIESCVFSECFLGLRLKYFCLCVGYGLVSWLHPLDGLVYYEEDLNWIIYFIYNKYNKQGAGEGV